MPIEKPKIKIEEGPEKAKPEVEKKVEVREQLLEEAPGQKVVEEEGGERILEKVLEKIKRYRESREKKAVSGPEKQELVKKEEPKRMVEKVSHFFFNPQASEHINHLVANAEKEGYEITRRRGLRAFLGAGGFIGVPPFCSPPPGKKGIGEVSRIYSAIHELNPETGHLGQLERYGVVEVYCHLRKYEIEASLTALKSVPRFGLFTDPMGVINQATILGLFAFGLGEPLYRLRHRREYRILENLYRMPLQEKN